eukprot:338698-Chlamydomonas_euryale.AAC.1
MVSATCAMLRMPVAALQASRMPHTAHCTASKPHATRSSLHGKQAAARHMLLVVPNPRNNGLQAVPNLVPTQVPTSESSHAPSESPHAPSESPHAP